MIVEAKEAAMTDDTKKVTDAATVADILKRAGAI